MAVHDVTTVQALEHVGHLPALEYHAHRVRLCFGHLRFPHQMIAGKEVCDPCIALVSRSCLMIPSSVATLRS